MSILTCTFTFFLIQYNRFRTEGVNLTEWASNTLAGRVFAPDVYRIGVAWLCLQLERATHLTVNRSLPMVQAVSYGLTLVLSYALLRHFKVFRSGSTAYRAAALGFFLAISQFPVLWIFPWERAETLPTALYIVVAAVLAGFPERIPFPAAFVCMGLASLAQSFARTDIPAAAGLAFLLAAIFPIAAPRPRSQMAAMGLVACLIGCTTQFYLQHIAYPHATYAPGVPKIQLLMNLRPFYPPDHLPIFFVSMLPLIFTLTLVGLHKFKLEPIEALIVVMCLVYLPVWLVAGLISEARIFVPFLLLAAPVMARVWASFLVDQPERAEAR